MTNPFELVADPTRRRILEVLSQNECSVGTLVEQVELSQPAVSRQLRVLREAGMVSARKDAQRRIYRLHPEKLKALDDWLEPFRKAWEERLDRMEDVLASMED